MISLELREKRIEYNHRSEPNGFWSSKEMMFSPILLLPYIGIDKIEDAPIIALCVM